MDHKKTSIKSSVIELDDPCADREASKYSNPIPSREYILGLFQRIQEPLSFEQLKIHLAIKETVQRVALQRRLKAMIRDGQLQLKAKTYYLKNLLTENYDDLLKQTSNSDQMKRVVGSFIKVNNFNYVVPFLNKDLALLQDILIPNGYENGAVVGDCVVVDVVVPLLKWVDPIGKVISNLGKSHHREPLIKAAIHSFEIPHNWPAEIKQELTKLSNHLDPQLLRSRVDLRKQHFITIDGEDAKDFDDAVFCEQLPRNNWKLYVAIADVSYYVRPGSVIDQQAYLRGNSVYFPGKVIPMLPEVLANKLCSLKSNADRLVMVCEMQISSKGKMTKFKFYEAVINCKGRFNYNQIHNYLIDQQLELNNLSQHVLANIKNLEQVYLLFKQQRDLRGAIDFETVESKVIFNQSGEPIEIKACQRNIAHKIIEECMLCANVAAAKLLQQHKLLSIYRVHEGPKSVKLLDFRAFLNGLGLSLDPEDPTVKDYAKLLQKITDRPDCEVIQMLLLRSMCQAIYSTENVGHFGLAYPAYTHFTSPIRRYTDLVVHRHIKNIIHNVHPELSGATEELAAIAKHCSISERKADEATREVIKAAKCQYLIKYIGNKFHGIVSGVTKFGLFIELKDLYIDGLLHITSLTNDYYLHDPVHHKLIGEHTGKIYSLGMILEVTLVKVDPERRRIDFILTEELDQKSKKFKRSRQPNEKSKTNVTTTPSRSNKKDRKKLKKHANSRSTNKTARSNKAPKNVKKISKKY